jgi:hypothetical protein
MLNPRTQKGKCKGDIPIFPEKARISRGRKTGQLRFYDQGIYTGTMSVSESAEGMASVSAGGSVVIYVGVTNGGYGKDTGTHVVFDDAR